MEIDILITHKLWFFVYKMTAILLFFIQIIILLHVNNFFFKKKLKEKSQIYIYKEQSN